MANTKAAVRKPIRRTPRRVIQIKFTLSNAKAVRFAAAQTAWSDRAISAWLKMELEKIFITRHDEVSLTFDAR